MFSKIISRFKRRLTVAVDLVRLLPGGENGGVKPAVFAFLEWMGRRDRNRVTFIFITNEVTRDELMGIARSGDRVWCSHSTASDPSPGAGPDRVDTDRLIQTGVDIIYNPFGPDRLGGGRIPFVSLLVDLLHREVPEALPPEEVDHREAFFADACARAALIHVISDDVGDRLVNTYGLDRKRLFRTYLPLQQIDVGGLWRRGHAATEGPFFIYPANAWAHKNHIRLMEAFRLFLEQVPGRRDIWSLVLTGADRISGDALDRTIESQGLDGRVIRAGYLKRRDYLATLHRATGLVYPSLNEGFGIPILEAQQAGIPIVCSDRGSLPEVAGLGARLIDPLTPSAIAAAMGELSDDDALRESLVRKGRENLKRFDFDREAGCFADALRSAAGRGRG